ncbi:FG-GAP repeat protein [Aestuariibacter sp. AA17]|uniref:FG-GAP repeat protein n=1 Tax=Fluctibacter corallii TaxID=2984329 RepID=A0ABT3ADK7_9ALTE|nr:FG-GAP repeat protein [Aestuariibacter sp. AA17]MCV2886321.1 FG-GAP repeat protein [Aestuariibacter sp. AA17]
MHKFISHLFACLTLIATNSFATQDMILAKDGKAGDSFGYSAAIDGNTVLIGAHQADINGIRNAGAAYVYVLDKNGWQQQAKLIADPVFTEDTVGGKVALHNNIAMLGVMRRDDKGQDSGAVVAFEREKGLWKQQHIFTAPDAKPGDAFGQSIALTDNFLVIGAPRNDASGNDSGAAYIYKRENGAWHYQTKITASDGAQGDLFGISVAIDDNTILVGADLHDDKAEKAGAVYVYVHDKNTWKQEAKLMASDGGNTDIFGVRVAVSGDTALISARRDDIEGIGIDAGSAYIFERSGTIWTQHTKLISPDGQADDRFGRDVALKKDTAIISAMNHDANGPDTGALYVYEKRGDSWRFASKVVANTSNPNDRFGWSVALSDDVAAITAPNHGTNGQDSGAVFIQKLNEAQ